MRVKKKIQLKYFFMLNSNNNNNNLLIEKLSEVQLGVTDKDYYLSPAKMKKKGFLIVFLQ